MWCSSDQSFFLAWIQTQLVHQWPFVSLSFLEKFFFDNSHFTIWPWTCPEHRDLYKPRWDVVSCLCCWKLDASTQFRRRIESVSCVILERLKKKLTFCSTVHYIIVLYPGFSLIYLQNVLICFPCPMSVDFSTCLHTKSFTLLSLC